MFLMFTGFKKIIEPLIEKKISPTIEQKTQPHTQQTAKAKAVTISNKNNLDETIRVFQRMDNLFYTLVFIFLFLAFIKTVFNKYFKQVFNLSFQSAFGQKQTREQLSQSTLPALMMNLLFIF